MEHFAELSRSLKVSELIHNLAVSDLYETGFSLIGETDELANEHIERLPHWPRRWQGRG